MNIPDHLDSDKEAAKTSADVEVVALTDDQLINCI